MQESDEIINDSCNAFEDWQDYNIKLHNTSPAK